MIVVLVYLHREVAWWFTAGLGERVTWLGVSVVAGAGVYAVALLLLGMRPDQFRLRHD